MEKKEKIYMILTNGFNPDVRVLKEAVALYEMGYEVEILCWDRKGEHIDKTNEVREDGVKVTRFFIPSKPGSGIKQLHPFFKFMKKIRKYLKNKTYSYIHCHDFDGMIVGHYATILREKKQIIFDMHESYKQKIYYKIRFIFKYFLKKADYIVYVNEEQIKGWKQKEKEKCIYLPNYPEIRHYIPIEKESQNGIYRINFIGAVRDYDSLTTLIEAGKQKDNVKVGIYGDGVAYERLKKENKNKNVIISGKFDGSKESGKIYQNTDILYCVYNPEIYNWRISYPTKLFEAIITKTPIIVAENTVASDFVQKKGIGAVVAYKNKEALINIIDKVILHYEEYRNNLEKISKEYQWEDISKNLEQIYTKECS